MRNALLFLFMATIGYNQVPVTSNFSDFLKLVESNQASALSLDTESYQFGDLVKNQVYIEVLPFNEDYQFLLNETFGNTQDFGNQELPKGDAFVCLCKKNDLLLILKRWKDGQHRKSDYEKFDCKHKSLSNGAVLHEKSFWAEIQFSEKLNKLSQYAERIDFSDKVEVFVFKNRGNQKKKILKVMYDIPFKNIVKVVEDESFIVSVKSKEGKELYNVQPVLGWKKLFPDWTPYEKLNSGFWGEPDNQIALANGRYSKTISIEPTETQKLTIVGETTFFVKDSTYQEKDLVGLNLGQGQKNIRRTAYLDYGSNLFYGVSGLLAKEQKMTIAFKSEIPLSSIIVFDNASGRELGRVEQAPFECTIPNHSNGIDLKVTYARLNKVRVDFSIEK